MVMLSVQSEFPRQLRQGGESNCLYYWQSELHWDRIARPLIRWKQWFSFQRDYQDSTWGQNMAMFSARRKGMNITGVQLSTCPSHHWQIVVLTVWLPRTPLCFRMPQRLVLVTQGTLWALPAGFQAVTISSRSPCATLQDARTVGQERATLCTWKQRAFLPLPAFKAAPTFQWFYWRVLLQLASTQLCEFVASALKTSHLRNVWLGH